MNKMTWLDLYNFLSERANNINAVGTFDWNKPVLVHDADTGDEVNCDTWIVSTNGGEKKLVLVTNLENIFSEEK
jgi:hypothetical protein